MNTCTNKTKKYFTQIPNELIRNSSISDRARFLYCYMSSMSEDWKFYQSKMAKDLGYSKDTLRKYLDELVSTGYLKRTQRRTEDGKFDSFDYVIDFIPDKNFTVSEKTRDGEIPLRENPSLKNKNLKEEKLIKNKNLKDNIKNSDEFLEDEIEIKQNDKVNPFTLIANLQSQNEKEKTSGKKEKESRAEPKPERKPNPTYEAFTVFCQTFEQLSGAAYPTDQNGNYIMSPKDAGGMVYLLRWLEKVDRNGNTIEALKVFLQAAWSLPDKWLKANFTPSILYGRTNKIYMAYQIVSPAAKKKAYDDEVDRLLAEAMKKYQTQ